MENKDYIRHRRKLIVPPPGVMGFLFSHYFTECVEIKDEVKKPQKTGKFMVTCSFSFLFAGTMVIIHSNSDEIEKSFTAYVEKLRLIKQMAVDALAHIENGQGPIVIRNFLNNETINDGFGATLFITIDPDIKSNYCIFEIASCYKKYRHGTDVKGMRHYLTALIKFISDEVEKDLTVVSKLIDDHCVKGEDNGT